MATNLILPEVLNHYNIYDEDANRLIGVSGEIELGELEAITDTIEGAGVLGEIDDPVTGQFQNLKIKIPFSVLYDDVFKLMNTTKPPALTLRASMQCMDPATGITDYYPVRIFVRGKVANSNLGKISKGKKGEPELELSVLYIKIRINETIVLELDKLNFRYVLNGVDLMEKVRKQV